MKYPRVIIIGETFRINGGGGITLINLFKDWPAENIGIVTERIALTIPGSPYSYYQIGREELKFPFPFHFFQSFVPSGPYRFSQDNKSVARKYNKKFNILQAIKKKAHPFLDEFLRLSGFAASFYEIRMSERLRQWITDFDPDIIYVQPFHHNTMRFGNLLNREFKIPIAIHIMDDSVKYINRSVFLKGMRQRVIERDFEELIRNAQIHMCISDSMASEYLKRYGKVFLPFRNPIDTDKWLQYRKNDFYVSENVLKIIYTGRLSSPTVSGIIDLCKVIDSLNKRGKTVVLDIYTHDKNKSFLKNIKNSNSIVINEPKDVDEMPQLIQKYDVFFLCLDFDKKARKYAQYSLSTRTSEGMISGVPVLVYAPSDSAMIEYFNKNRSGSTVSNKSLPELEAAILKLWNDVAYREMISKNAVRTAYSDSNSINVRDEFRKVLTNYRNE